MQSYLVHTGPYSLESAQAVLLAMPRLNDFTYLPFNNVNRIYTEQTFLKNT